MFCACCSVVCCRLRTYVLLVMHYVVALLNNVLYCAMCVAFVLLVRIAFLWLICVVVGWCRYMFLAVASTFWCWLLCGFWCYCYSSLALMAANLPRMLLHILPNNWVALWRKQTPALGLQLPSCRICSLSVLFYSFVWLFFSSLLLLLLPFDFLFFSDRREATPTD